MKDPAIFTLGILKYIYNKADANRGAFKERRNIQSSPHNPHGNSASFAEID
jgi:hypothetical protein